MPLATSFFDQVYEGEFSLLNFSVSLSNSADDYSDIRDLAPDARLDEWMRRTSTFHEYRHYHDLIGTTCGFHTILHVTRLVDEFLYECMERGRGVLRAPVRKHDPLSRLVRLYDDYQNFLRALVGDFPFEAARDGQDFTDVRPVEAVGLRLNVPFFILTDIDHVTGSHVDRLTPVGLRALMESTALGVQVFVSMVGASENMDDTGSEEEMLARGKRYFDKWGDIIRSGFIVPYGVCHFYYHYMTRRFPPAAEVGAFADAAMIYSGFSEAAFPNTPPTFDHPGLIFCNLVNAATQVDRDGPLSAMLSDAGALVDLPPYGQTIEQLANRLATEPDSTVPAPLRPESARSGFINTLRSHMFRDHAMIMSARASNPDDWLIPSEYLQKYDRVPMPPFLSLGSHTSLSRPGSEMAYWVTWMFLLELIEDLIERGELTCPVYKRFKVLGERFSFPDPEREGADTNCVRFIEGDLCGKFDGGYKKGQPAHCPFATQVNKFLGWLSYDGVDFTRGGGEE